MSWQISQITTTRQSTRGGSTPSDRRAPRAPYRGNSRAPGRSCAIPSFRQSSPELLQPPHRHAAFPHIVNSFVWTREGSRIGSGGRISVDGGGHSGNRRKSHDWRTPGALRALPKRPAGGAQHRKSCSISPMDSSDSSLASAAVLQQRRRSNPGMKSAMRKTLFLIGAPALLSACATVLHPINKPHRE